MNAQMNAQNMVAYLTQSGVVESGTVSSLQWNGLT
jgi:hypothetical protein